jgi:hypothetical protein
MNKTTFFFQGVTLQKNKKWGVTIRKRLKTTGVKLNRIPYATLSETNNNRVNDHDGSIWYVYIFFIRSPIDYRDVFERVTHVHVYIAPSARNSIVAAPTQVCALGFVHLRGEKIDWNVRTGDFFPVWQNLNDSSNKSFSLSTYSDVLTPRSQLTTIYQHSRCKTHYAVYTLTRTHINIYFFINLRREKILNVLSYTWVHAHR